MLRLFNSASLVLPVCLVLLFCISVGCTKETPTAPAPQADPGAVQQGIEESKARREEMGATDTADVDAKQQAAETTGG